MSIVCPVLRANVYYVLAQSSASTTPSIATRPTRSGNLVDFQLTYIHGLNNRNIAHIDEVLADYGAIRGAIVVTRGMKDVCQLHMLSGKEPVADSHERIFAFQQGGYEVDVACNRARSHVPERVPHGLGTDLKLSLPKRVCVPLQLDEVIAIRRVSEVRANVVATLLDRVRYER